MAQPERSASSTAAQLPRRSLVAAGAWTVPVLAAATAAPAYAASCRSRNFDYVVDWKLASADYNRATRTAIARSATGGQNMNVTFTGSNISTTNLYTLDPTYNLTVPGPSGTTDGTVPNVTNLGDIVPNGAERGLCLQHTVTSAAGVDAATGAPNRGQKLVIDFPRAVSGLTFWLVDIDGPTTGYWDRVRFTTAPSIVSADPFLKGTGAGTTPFLYNPTQPPVQNPPASNANNLGENSAGGRVQVRFAGPTQQVEMQYFNISGTGIQRLFLHNLSFTSAGC